MGLLTPVALCNSPDDGWDGVGDVRWCLKPAARWWLRPVQGQRGLVCMCPDHAGVWESSRLQEVSMDEAVAHCVLGEWDS